jgi:hypothetical protein
MMTMTLLQLLRPRPRSCTTGSCESTSFRGGTGRRQCGSALRQWEAPSCRWRGRGASESLRTRGSRAPPWRLIRRPGDREGIHITAPEPTTRRIL